MNRAIRGVGIALSAVTFMIWTGVTASAETDTSDVQDTVQAIDAIAGTVRSDAIDVSRADVTVDASGTSVDLTRNAEDGIAVETPTGANFDIGLPFASAADTAVIVDGAVVYDNNNGSTTTPLVNQDGSVQILTTIADANAPTAYEYQFDLGQGGTLKTNADGGVDVLDGTGGTIASIAAPWAIDSNGLPVPTWYEISGNNLVQRISHLGHATAYPVVADPKVTYGLVTGTIYFNKAETKDFSSAGSLISACAVVAKVPGALGVALLAGCLVNGISWVVQANRAVNRSMCLKIKFTAPVVGLATWWPDIYGGGYCT